MEGRGGSSWVVGRDLRKREEYGEGGMLDRRGGSWVEGLKYADYWWIELRIHEYTERGDNDSVKQAGKGTIATPISGGCCGGAAATTTQ